MNRRIAKTLDEFETRISKIVLRAALPEQRIEQLADLQARRQLTLALFKNLLTFLESGHITIIDGHAAMTNALTVGKYPQWFSLKNVVDRWNWDWQDYGEGIEPLSNDEEFREFLQAGIELLTDCDKFGELMKITEK